MFNRIQDKINELIEKNEKLQARIDKAQSKLENIDEIILKTHKKDYNEAKKLEAFRIANGMYNENYVEITPESHFNFLKDMEVGMLNIKIDNANSSINENNRKIKELEEKGLSIIQKQMNIKNIEKYPVIEEFLGNWKKQVYNMITTDSDRKDHQYYVKTFGDNWKSVLDKDLDCEVDNKRAFIVRRVEEKAGKILDAKHLYIGNDGNINGCIVGEKKEVSVATIIAGGMVQCLHYRVLIN